MEAIIKGFLLGLSTGVFCIGYCGPLFVPYLLSEKIIFKTNLFRVAEFLTGRLFAYLIWGVVIGFSSSFFQSAYMRKLTAFALLFSSILLLVYGAIKNFPQFKLCQKLENTKGLKSFPFLLGMTVGINICPPFLTAISYLLTVGRIKDCLIFFIFFFVGTTLYMIPLIFLHFFTRIDRIRFVGRVATIIAGLWFLIQSISLF